MMVRRAGKKRRGATALEAALVLPVLLTIILGMVVIGIGILRYQQLAFLAREGTRWASVHGGQYANDNGGGKPASADDVYTNAIQPRMAGLNPAGFHYTVTWNGGTFPYHTVVNAQNELVKITNTVTVTVTYDWVPEALLGGVTLRASSEMPMSY